MTFLHMTHDATFSFINLKRTRKCHVNVIIIHGEIINVVLLVKSVLWANNG